MERYSWEFIEDEDDGEVVFSGMEVHAKGDWVKYKDASEQLTAYKQGAAHDSRIIHEQEAEIEQLKAEIAKARKIMESLVWDMRTTAGTSEPFTSDEEEDLYAANQWLKENSDEV